MSLEHPAIVGTVADRSTLLALPHLAETVALCDLLEFRIDALLDDAELLQSRIETLAAPLVLTVRDPAEGGRGNLSERERTHWFGRFVSRATLVDLEIRNLDTLGETVAQSHDEGATVLGSYHDFQRTPPRSELREAVARGREQGADAIKIAVTLHRADDLHTLLGVFEEERAHGPMAIMGMGPMGMGSRVLFAQCGSLLTYAYLQHANAPGQWSATRMRTLFEDLGIERPAPSAPPAP